MSETGKTGKSKTAGSGKARPRTARLADALRENLRKRKEQARKREVAPPDIVSPPSSPHRDG